jgi:microcystin-dependent protein
MAQTVNWLQNVSYSAQVDRQFIEAVVPSEGVLSPLSLKVVAQSPAAMTVLVKSGSGFIKGDNSSNQGMYCVDSNTDESTATFSLPASGYKRIDSVCMCVKDPDASGPAGNSANIIIVQGTAVLTSATASAPALPATHIRLANVAISATTSSIVSADITDTRELCGGLDHVGTIQMWGGGGSLLPAGWVLCQGQAISRTTYPELFELIGSTYGSGDGSTTFNVPNLSSRLPMGVGSASGLTTRAIAATGGVETVTIATTNLPSHSHTIDHDHPNTVTDTQGAHSHQESFTYYVGTGGNVASGSAFIVNYGAYQGNTSTAGAHAHNLDVPAFGGSSGATGDGTAMTNTPPFIALNFIMRAA